MSTHFSLADAGFQKLKDFNEWQPNPSPCHGLEMPALFGGSRDPAACVVVDEATKEVCSTCNGFVEWWLSVVGLPSQVDAYWRRLDHCYMTLMSQSQREQIDRPLVYLPPVYAGWNMGHDLSVLLVTILAFRRAVQEEVGHRQPQERVALGVSQSTLRRSPNSLAILNAFVPQNRIVELVPNLPYRFSNLIAPPCCFFHLHREALVAPMVDHLVVTAKSSPVIQSIWSPVIEQCKGKFVLCKRSSHAAVRRQGIMPAWVEQSLHQNGWFILDPEQADIFEMIYLLQNASTLLLGSGAIQYTHKIFVSRQATIHLLFDNPNYPAYSGHEEIRHRIPELDWDNDTHWRRLLEKLKVVV
jgi:hypothetical protein